MAILIKGTDITLYTASGTETVTNVLIGEPANGGYTLGIPKGDAHDWTDRKIGFFGRLWRTVGYPVEGIEANIPLCWHRKVTVQPLDTNGTVTVYEANSYVRHLFADVKITDLRGQRTAKTGDQITGDLSVRLLSVCPGDGYIPKSGDLLVTCDCPVIFRDQTEQAISETMQMLRQHDYAVIRSVTSETVGIVPDYIITAR